MQIKYIAEIVSDYISNPNIQGAIFINGKWGSGKTFFWKNTLSSFIQSLKSKKGKNLKTLYISLNGLTNLKSITSQILASKFGIQEKNKVTRALYKFANYLPKVIEKISVGTNYSQEVISAIDFIDFIDFSDTVICFDDVERIGSKITIEDVLGYINLKFIEHNSIRTIFLGDESNIHYSKNREIKEKIFYREIKFELDENDIISILEERYEQISKPFSLEIKENSEFIKSAMQRCDLSNLRSLIFAFDNLKIFFDALERDSFTQLNTKLINFVLIITAEFKTNQVNATNLFTEEKINVYQNNPITSSILARQFKNNEIEEPIPDSVKFHEKYIRNSSVLYTYFDSVYNTIITGYFDVQQFKSEVLSFIESKEKKLLSKFWNYQELSNEEFNNLMEQIIKLIKNGKISIYQYPALYERLMIFSNKNILNYSEENLRDIFHTGLLTASENENYYDEHTFSHGHIFSSDHKFAKELYKYVQDYQQKIKMKQKRERIESLYDILKRDDAFSQQDHFIHIGEKFEPIFDIISVEQIASIIDECSNRNLYKFNMFIESKYKEMGNMTHLLLSDEKDLRELKTKLEGILSSSKNRNLQYFLLSELINVIEHILEVFKEYHKQKNNS